MTFHLRDYQQVCVDKVQSELVEHHSTLYVLPTGSGKTITFAHLIKNTPKRALVLAHRKVLINQAADKIFRAIQEPCAVEMGESWSDENIAPGLLQMKARVVISTIQSQISGSHGAERMRRFDPKEFSLIVIDESHRSTSDSYRRVIEYYRAGNPEIRIVGCTATPDRADEAALGQVYESVAYEYEIAQAIDDGWLVPIHQKQVYVDSLDFSSVRTTAGDLNGADLATVMEFEENLHRIADPLYELATGRRTIVFAVSVAQAERLAEILNRHEPNCAMAVSAETPDANREGIFGDFREGKIQFLVNVGIVSEGFDEPLATVIAMARPTKSRALYAQMCLDEQTEILTRTGWKNDIKIGEAVAAMVPETGEIRFVPAQQTVRRYLEENERWVELDTVACDIRVTDQHRMLYDHKRKTGWKFKTALELSSLTSGCYIPISGMEEANGIPLSDDELRFIGWVMTDGTINKTTGAIAITQGTHQPWLEEIQRVIDSCGFKNTRSVKNRETQFNQTSPATMWTISGGEPRGSDKHLRGWNHLRQWLSKDLAPSLMDMSERQFGIFLEALHLGDGAKQTSAKTWTRRSYHISGANKTMMDRLQALAVLRGWKANISQHNYNQNPLYIIHLKRKRTAAVGSRYDNRKSWRITMPTALEKCWCVTNEIGTIVTRRNGKVAIVGNCGRGTRPLTGLVDSLATPEQRRQAIATSIKPSMEVIDFVGNSGRHTLISAADILGGKFSEEAIKAVKKDAKEGITKDVLDALREAEQRLAKEKAMEADKRKHVVGKAVYRTAFVSPFDILGLTPSKPRGWDNVKSVTTKQKQILSDNGIKDNADLSYTNVQQLIQEIFDRRKTGRCTYKQARFLQTYGYDGNVSFNEASRIMDALKANDWKPLTKAAPEPAPQFQKPIRRPPPAPSKPQPTFFEGCSDPVTERVDAPF